MFMICKVLGSVLIVLSMIYLVCFKLLASYITFMYLDDILWILNKMKTACIAGRTYNLVFEECNCLKYYSSPWCCFLVDDKRYKLADDILKDTGKRNKKEEQEYLVLAVTQIEYEKNVFKNFYIDNKKTFILTGVSLGLITVIVFI